MAPHTKRDNFSNHIKSVLAKRSGFLCSVCQAVTVGPSAESAESVTNIGVAAHITAAAPGGPRYNKSMTNEARSSIKNGIWLCQNHAKLIDDDPSTWTVSKLQETKHQHEHNVKRLLGIPEGTAAQALDISDFQNAPTITINEYAFIHVRSLVGPYKSILKPVLHDKGLKNGSEMGILMCGSPPEYRGANRETPWTTFVNADWLRWVLNALNEGYKPALDAPPEQIYGQIPGWPDTFLDFLQSIIKTNATFQWRRHQNGYLVLSQKL